jgi:hypothetical protein
MQMLGKFARYPLTFGPSWIHPLDGLSDYLGNTVRLYAKREDCNSGLAFGGNKLRKLEFIVPDAIASGADTLVSIGGVQSNHTRMVAATAAKIGMKCRLEQESWVPHEDAVYDRVAVPPANRRNLPERRRTRCRFPNLVVAGPWPRCCGVFVSVFQHSVARRSTAANLDRCQRGTRNRLIRALARQSCPCP